VSAFIEKISRYLDSGAQFMVAATMFLTTANVLLRRLFGAPIKGTVEFVQLFIALAVGLGMAQCAVQGGHIAVTFFADKLPAKFQYALIAVVDLVVAAFLGVSAWQLFKYGENMRQMGEIALTTGIPIYPVVYVVALGFVLYFLVVILELGRTFRQLFGTKNTTRPSEC